MGQKKSKLKEVKKEIPKKEVSNFGYRGSVEHKATAWEYTIPSTGEKLTDKKKAQERLEELQLQELLNNCPLSQGMIEPIREEATKYFKWIIANYKLYNRTANDFDDGCEEEDC